MAAAGPALAPVASGLLIDPVLTRIVNSYPADRMRMARLLKAIGTLHGSDCLTPQGLCHLSYKTVRVSGLLDGRSPDDPGTTLALEFLEVCAATEGSIDLDDVRRFVS